MIFKNESFQKVNFILFLIIFGLFFIVLANADILHLTNGQILSGVVISETEKELELQTLVGRMRISVSLISSRIYASKLQSYVRLAQEAVIHKRFLIAREFIQQALYYDPDNTALKMKFNEIRYYEIENDKIKPILDSIQDENIDNFSTALNAIEVLIQEYRAQNFVIKLERIKADIHVKYALFLFNYVRHSEGLEQLRLARRLDENNINLHQAMAKFQEQQGNIFLAQLERNRAIELAQLEREREVILQQIFISADNYISGEPSPAYWAEQARLAALRDRPRPMTTFPLIPMDNALSLLLQAYNAGPGAVVVYDGAVPYRETINYVQRVNKWLFRVPEASDFDHLIRKYAMKYNLDVNLVRAIIQVESSFNPRARSHADARGLMQITSATWEDTVDRIGVNWPFERYAYDPEKNIKVGCHFLAWLKTQYLPQFFDIAKL